MITLESDVLRARIHPHGAELQSLYHKALDLEYMWRGDPAYWGKYSPVLFPIVGQLANNRYTWQGKEYSLPRHGFAREMDFTVTAADATSAIFTLESNEATRAVYPFDFVLQLKYVLDADTISLTYEVTHTGTGEMFFSVGAHPAFAVPLTENTRYNDYYLQFSSKETAPRRLISDGLIDQPEALLEDADRIPLSHSLFYKDALVFKGLHSRTVSLRSDMTAHGLTMDISGFPYLGIWATKDAPFVCLEPWQGIADAVQHNGQLADKEGIISLQAGAKKQFRWQVQCF